MRALLLALCLLLPLAPAQAQSRLYSQPELDALLAPIALYPDPLLSQILTAAVYPDQVAQAADWSRRNPGASGDDAVQMVQDQAWEPSVKGLVAYPDVLARMGESPVSRQVFVTRAHVWSRPWHDVPESQRQPIIQSTPRPQWRSDAPRPQMRAEAPRAQRRPEARHERPVALASPSSSFQPRQQAFQQSQHQARGGRRSWNALDFPRLRLEG